MRHKSICYQWEYDTLTYYQHDETRISQIIAAELLEIKHEQNHHNAYVRHLAGQLQQLLGITE